MTNRGLKRGALDLLDEYNHWQPSIAEAYLKGDIPQHLERFVFDVIGTGDVEEARKRLDRTTWRLEERVAKLEEEVRELYTLLRSVRTTRRL